MRLIPLTDPQAERVIPHRSNFVPWNESGAWKIGFGISTSKLLIPSRFRSVGTEEYLLDDDVAAGEAIFVQHIFIEFRVRNESTEGGPKMGTLMEERRSFRKGCLNR